MKEEKTYQNIDYDALVFTFYLIQITVIKLQIFTELSLFFA